MAINTREVIDLSKFADPSITVTKDYLVSWQFRPKDVAGTTMRYTLPEGSEIIFKKDPYTGEYSLATQTIIPNRKKERVPGRFERMCNVFESACNNLAELLKYKPAVAILKLPLGIPVGQIPQTVRAQC